MAALSLLTRITLVLCGLVFLTIIMSGLGTRMGLWDWPTGLAILRRGTQFAVGLTLWGLVLLVIAIVQRSRRDVVWLGHGVALLLIPLFWIGWHYHLARALPAIHDITTDVQNPPQFRSLPGVPERSLTYDSDNALPQAQAYADIQPIGTDQPPEAVLRRALEVAEDLGWQVVEFDQDAIWFQAVDTTFWFGFEDDVVVRVTPLLAGSVVDLRSASRVGRHDFGANASRIRAFRDRFVPPDDPAVQRAVEWLLSKEIRRAGDWSVRNRGGEPAGARG
jgi:uncharacterized protein (DUF1499 family)